MESVTAQSCFTLRARLVFRDVLTRARWVMSQVRRGMRSLKSPRSGSAVGFPLYTPYKRDWLVGSCWLWIFIFKTDSEQDVHKNVRIL